MLPAEINPEIWGWNFVALRLSEILIRDQLPSILISALLIFLVTSIAIIAGLSALAFSSFIPVAYFGMLISIALVATTFDALVILPALLELRAK